MAGSPPFAIGTAAGLTAALAALLLAALPAAPAAGAAKCTERSARTVAANKDARVYTVSRGDDTLLRGCLRRTGRVRTLERAFATSGLYSSASSSFAHVRLAGRQVAWYREYDAEYVPECKAHCPPGVTGSRTSETSIRVTSLTTGTRREASVEAPPAGHVLRLNRFGQAVWGDWLPGNQVAVRALVGNGVQTLDEGAIHPEDITLTGRVAGWIKDGAPHTRRLA
jgi:hypothetical protein